MLPYFTNKKIYVLVGVWSCIFVLALISSYLYFTLSKVVVTPTPTPTATPINPFITPSPTPTDNSINILLVGYGGGNHSGGSLSDVLQVVHINPDTKNVHLISVPRDTWIPLPVSDSKVEYQKINAAYAIGGDDRNYPQKPLQFTGEGGAGEMAKYAVSVVLGLPIHYFASIDFDGFTKSIDQLGGIEVSVPVTFDDYFYPIKGKENDSCNISSEEMVAIHATMSGYQLEQQFRCRYEHLHFDQGLISMDGTTALKFVRSRHSDQHGGDFARSARQKEVLIGIENKAISLGALNNTISFMNRFTNSVKTDIDSSDIKSLLEKIGDPREYTTTQIVLNIDNVFINSTSAQGAYILVPKDGNNNWQGIHQFIQGQIK